MAVTVIVESDHLNFTEPMYCGEEQIGKEIKDLQVTDRNNTWLAMVVIPKLPSHFWCAFECPPNFEFPISEGNRFGWAVVFVPSSIAPLRNCGQSIKPHVQGKNRLVLRNSNLTLPLCLLWLWAKVVSTVVEFDYSIFCGLESVFSILLVKNYLFY